MTNTIACDFTSSGAFVIEAEGTRRPRRPSTYDGPIGDGVVVHGNGDEGARGGPGDERPSAGVRQKIFSARSAAFLGYLAIQIVIVFGLATIRTQTSAEYLRLDFTGLQPRLWTIPLLYKVLPTDFSRMAGQVVLAAACWWVLAAVASSMVRDRRVRIGLQLVILALGVIGPIAAWNSYIGAESATISLTALLVAVWLKYVEEPRTVAAVWVVVVSTLWMFTRQDHVVMTALVAVVVVVCVALARVTKMRRSALTAFVAIALVVMSALGLVSMSRNHSLAKVNVTAIIARRVLTNAAYHQYFLRHGMPLSPEIADYANSLIPEGLGGNPEFAKWVDEHGEDTYIKFLVSHPGYTLTRPLGSLTGEEPTLLNPASSLDAFSDDVTPSFVSPDANWARHRDVLPPVVQDLLWTPGQSADVIWLTVVALGLVLVAWRRRVADRRLLVPAVVLGTVVPHVYLVWLTSATELDRHALIIGVSVRIALWLMAAFALDALLGAAPPASSAATGEFDSERAGEH